MRKEARSENAPKPMRTAEEVEKLSQGLNEVQKHWIVHSHNGNTITLTPESVHTQAVVDGMRQTLDFLTGKSDNVPFLEERGIKL